MSVDIHRHFHDELSHVKVRLLTMSGEAEAALGLSVEALLERDPDKAHRVIVGDRVIDSMEVEIEEQCINLLALQQPMARDLRMLTSALKIANDLERVGASGRAGLSHALHRQTECKPLFVAELVRLLTAEGAFAAREAGSGAAPLVPDGVRAVIGRRLARGRGCLVCKQTGYSGRVAVFEVLELTKPVRRLVLDGLNEDQIKSKALNEGLLTLRKSGIKKLLDGVTTVDEVRAVTLADHD